MKDKKPAWRAKPIGSSWLFPPRSSRTLRNLRVELLRHGMRDDGPAPHAPVPRPFFQKELMVKELKNMSQNF